MSQLGPSKSGDCEHDGMDDGTSDGLDDGADVGVADGIAEGGLLGVADGPAEGAPLGFMEGMELGCSVNTHIPGRLSSTSQVAVLVVHCHQLPASRDRLTQ